jgi:hypothetical protein
LCGTPVISSAARLNEVTTHSMSTVKTPSEMLSRIDSVGDRAAGFMFLVRAFMAVISGNPGPGLLIALHSVK